MQTPTPLSPSRQRATFWLTFIGAFSRSSRTLSLLLLLSVILFAVTVILAPPNQLARFILPAVALILGLLLGIRISLRSVSQVVDATLGEGSVHSAASKLLPDRSAREPDIGPLGIEACDRLIVALQSRMQKLRQEFRQGSEQHSALAKRYNLLTANLAAGVTIEDIKGGVHFCSPYTEVLTGYPVEDFLHRKHSLMTLALPEHQERVGRAWNVAKIGEDILVRYQIAHRSGIRLWLETHLVPVCDERGEVESILGVTIDVTDSLNYQKQIEQQNRDLGEFAYMVSHDLKAPLFTIQGMASAILEDSGSELADTAKEFLQHILEASRRLETLIASVVEFSSLATAPLQQVEVDLQSVMENVLRDQSELIRRSSAIVNIESLLPTVRGDETRLYQVFANLIGNALKYREDSRKPDVSVRSRWSESDLVLIEIADNGRGIANDQLEQIFRPFTRLGETDVEGTGIGLACVRKIVERLGGKVSVQSTLGVGSVFTVALPLPDKKPQQVPASLERLYER